VIFKNLIEVTEYFSGKEACINFLTKKRWVGKPNCPFCDNTDKIYTLKGKYKRYKCAKCEKQFSVIKGTIFENSSIPLQKWFVAIYLISTHKKAISSVQLANHIGVTQKSAWFMAHRIRHAMKVKSFDTQLFGVIQTDESFVGGKNKYRHAHKKVPKSQGRAFIDKTPVLGLLHTGGRVFLRAIPDTTSATIQPIIKQMVDTNSILVTDEWKAYNGLSDHYAHIVLDHTVAERARGCFHTNGIEGFWGLFKRAIIGIYHYVSRKHLQRYCDELSDRYNSRKLDNTTRFNNVFSKINCRLTYKNLIGVNTSYQ